MKNIFLIIAILIFSSANLYSKCTGYTVSVVQLSDGPLNGDAKAQATVTINGGSTNYKILWDGINSTSLQSQNMNGGFHMLEIIDSVLMCRDTTFFTLVDTGCPQVNVNLMESDDCFLNDLSLKAYVSSSSSGVYNYAWSNGANTDSIYGILSGTYSLTVTIPNTSCSYTATNTVVDDTCNVCNNLYCYISSQDSCAFKNDISLTAFKSNISSSITYLWNTGETTQTITNKSTGTYTVTVTFLNYSCSKSSSISVVDRDSCDPCLYLNISMKELDSCGYNDATIYPAIYGYGSYSYLWNTGSTSRSLSNVSSGLYKITVTDLIQGCSKTDSIIVVDDTCRECPTPFFIGLIKDDSCGLNDVTLTASNFNIDTLIYRYLWNNGSKAKSIYNQTSGNYSVTVTDLYATCRMDSSFVVFDDTCGPCHYFGFSFQEIDSCGSGDVKLTPIIVGGSGNYSYLWSTGATSASLSNVTTGVYSLTLTDITKNCSRVLSYSVYDDSCGPCPNLNVYIQKQDSCGKNDVSLYSYVYGGSGNYTYLWNTGATTSFLANQTTGFYTVTVTDNLGGCTGTSFITLYDDTCNVCSNFYGYIQENDSCGLNDLKLYGLVYGGSGSYSYLWSNGSTSSTLLNPSGQYLTLTITDLINGCVIVDSINVLDDTCNPCDFNYHFLNSYDSCQLNDLSIYCIVSDPTSTSFLWSNGDTTQRISGLSSGVYKVTITFPNGCVRQDSILVVDTNFKCCQALFYNTFDSSVIQQFNSYSYSQNSTITSYGWTFGDNTNGTGQSVNHAYSTQGTYTVCHFIETLNGCKDTMCNTIIVPTMGKNLKIYHYGSPYVLDTFKYTYIDYYNMGTTTEYPVIEYSYPSGCSLIYSSHAVASNVGNKLTFNVGQLSPGQYGCIYVRFDVPGTYTLGTIKNDTAKILTFINDIDVSNNIAINADSVVGSWDPNEKLAYPQGIGSNGNIPMNTKEINYLIHFQNEGNWRTYTVRVEDEIDPALDISTLTLGDVSHPYRMVVNGSKLTWYFDNIELTPKAQNEEKSQGHVSYTLKLKKGLSEGTQIKNTAYIYFDKNPAIVTNTTVHTLKVDAVTNGIQSFNLGSNQIQINRNQNDLTLSSDKTIEKVEVFNLSGQKVNEINSKAKKAEFEISSWPSGIYLFNVKVKDDIHQLKIKL